MAFEDRPEASPEHQLADLRGSIGALERELVELSWWRWRRRRLTRQTLEDARELALLLEAQVAQAERTRAPRRER